MNVIRMIKQFGWEKHVFYKIGAKRDEELVGIHWRRIIKSGYFSQIVGLTGSGKTSLFSVCSLFRPTCP
jgi:ABC-type lipoprotein export system ATPase subunit